MPSFGVFQYSSNGFSLTDFSNYNKVIFVLVDSHCHLDRLNLDNYPKGLDEALSAARDRGVSAMLCVCISDNNRSAVLEIASRYPMVYASVGIHPSDVDASTDSSMDTLTNWASAERVVALGETGLDYFRGDECADFQRESFKNHLLVGSKTKLPVIVHTRSAQQDTIALMREHGDSSSAGVMHCFTESWAMAEQALELGYYISLSGIVTFKNADDLRELARKVPLERLLIETDSPYLAPVPFRGKPNEPKYLRDTAEYIAQLRGVSLEALAEQTTENFYALFNKALPS